MNSKINYSILSISTITIILSISMTIIILINSEQTINLDSITNNQFEYINELNNKCHSLSNHYCIYSNNSKCPNWIYNNINQTSQLNNDIKCYSNNNELTNNNNNENLLCCKFDHEPNNQLQVKSINQLNNNYNINTELTESVESMANNDNNTIDTILPLQMGACCSSLCSCFVNCPIMKVCTVCCDIGYSAVCNQGRDACSIPLCKCQKAR